VTVNLSIKNVDERIVERLRQRAARNHRSLQGELLAIIEEQALASAHLTPSDALRQARQRGLKTPREAVRMVRADRNAC
jgi:plasmid stability protein